MYSSIKKEINYWWLSLILGMLMIAFGLWCMVTPWTTIIAFSYMFALLFILSGLSEIFSLSIQNANWGWNLASGMLDLFIGLLILSLPVTELTLMLAYFVGFWMMFRSVSAIGISINLQKQAINGWGWLLTWAILGLLLSFIFLMSPFMANMFIVVIFSCSMLSYGLFKVFLALRLRKLANR